VNDSEFDHRSGGACLDVRLTPRRGSLAKTRRTWLGAAAILLATGGAWADGADPVAARAQLRQGYALKQQGKCKEALPFLLESARLDRQPKTLLNLGDCELAIGQLAAAQGHFVEARDLARQQGNDTLRSLGEKRLQDLEKRMPKLAIDLAKDAPAGTVVTRDGTEVGVVSLRTPLPIDVGHHTVVARGGGFERQFEVTLAEGETKELEVTPMGGKAIPKPATTTTATKDPPARTPEKEPGHAEGAAGTAAKVDAQHGAEEASSGSSAQRTLGFVALGVGVVGLGVGAYMTARMLSEKDELSRICTTGSCEGDEATQYDKTRQSAVNARNGSIVAYSVGGAAVLTGAILLLTAPKTTVTGWRMAPTIGASSFGAMVAGSW